MGPVRCSSEVPTAPDHAGQYPHLAGISRLTHSDPGRDLALRLAPGRPNLPFACHTGRDHPGVAYPANENPPFPAGF